eukprot:38371-Amphidinium_carterae.1
MVWKLKGWGWALALGRSGHFLLRPASVLPSTKCARAIVVRSEASSSGVLADAHICIWACDGKHKCRRTLLQQ